MVVETIYFFPGRYPVTLDMTWACTESIPDVFPRVPESVPVLQPLLFREKSNLFQFINGSSLEFFLTC